MLTTGLGNYPGLFSGNMLALHAANNFWQSRPTMRGRRLQQYFIKLQFPTRLTKIVCIAKLPKQGPKVIHIASARPSGGGALPFFETWISAVISSALRPIYAQNGNYPRNVPMLASRTCPRSFLRAQECAQRAPTFKPFSYTLVQLQAVWRYDGEGLIVKEGKVTPRAQVPA